MSIDSIRSEIGAFAKDIKINFGNVLTEEGSPDLDAMQIAAIALSCAYTVKNSEMIQAMEAEYQEMLGQEGIDACKSAAAIMAMNNVYYRFTHLVSDNEYQTMPASLRMQVIANPGMDKIAFELCSMAISAINGCGMCMDSHAKHLQEAGVSKKGIQSSVRIASVVKAVDQALYMNE